MIFVKRTALLSRSFFRSASLSIFSRMIGRVRIKVWTISFGTALISMPKI